GRRVLRGEDECATVSGRCGRNSVVECQLPKLDVAGSTPVARSCEFEELAPCRYKPRAGGGSLVALGSRGFRDPTYRDDGPLEQVCEGIQKGRLVARGAYPPDAAGQLATRSRSLARARLTMETCRPPPSPSSD